jgi:hypothetical protein
MSPPIQPPDGILWRSIPVGNLHIEDELSGDMGLSFPRIDGTSPFIRLPCKMSLEIISHVGLPAIYDALSHCANLRKVSLSRSRSKRVFTDYGEHVQYACVGPQPSRISNSVLDNPPFVAALPQRQWEHLVWLMKRAETSFCSIADHCVLSHLHHAKKLVPFKTFTSTGVDQTSSFSSDFFGGIAFGSNVFLRCHTDADFTMSITQAFLKGIPEYHLKDDVIAYFCFPTLGVAVPLPPGDYFMFNALIPHCRHLVPSMMPFLIAPLGKSRSLCLLTNIYTRICNLSTSSLIFPPPICHWSDSNIYLIRPLPDVCNNSGGIIQYGPWMLSDRGLYFLVSAFLIP